MKMYKYESLIIDQLIHYRIYIVATGKTHSIWASYNSRVSALRDLNGFAKRIA